jgi:endo-1,4-beta-xylanase
MRALCVAVIVTLLLGTSVCSSPHKVIADASYLDTGGAGSGRSGSDPGSAGSGGSIAPAGSGGGAGSGTGGTVAGTDGPIDAPAGDPDSPMVSPDAHQGRDGISGGDTSSAGDGLAGGGVGGSSSTGGAGGATTTSTRSQLKKFVGNTTTEGEGTIRSDFLKYWDQLSAGPEGQWGAVRAGTMQYDWTKLDSIYDFTRKNHIPFHEYAFILGLEEPRFLTSDDEARAAVEDWIRSFCTRYPDTELINVVYEPLHIKPYYSNAIGGAGTSGYDWIVQSLLWARSYCPNSILLVTDYNIIEYPAENQAFIKLVNAIRAAGAPIDAIGAEGIDAARVPTSTVKAYIDKLAATGLPIYITSYGIGQEDDAKQEAVMKEQFPLFWTDDRIKGITFWGYVVGYTWRTGLGLIATDGTPRPAMTWLMSYLGR